MREQSHKNEMRAALRGDFERLRARRTREDAAPSGSEVDGAEDAEHEARPPEPARLSWRDRLRGTR